MVKPAIYFVLTTILKMADKQKAARMFIDPPDFNFSGKTISGEGAHSDNTKNQQESQAENTMKSLLFAIFQIKAIRGLSEHVSLLRTKLFRKAKAEPKFRSPLYPTDAHLPKTILRVLRRPSTDR